jgi:hypothetical protein
MKVTDGKLENEKQSALDIRNIWASSTVHPAS